MPTISMFYGLIIRMYYAPSEHPPPHFHVYYGEHKAIVDIRTCEITEGDLPRKQTKLVLAWAELHQDDLMADWALIIVPASTGYAGFSRQLGTADFSPPSGYAGRNDDRGRRLESGDERRRAFQNSAAAITRHSMSPSVKRVSPLENYLILVEFENEEVGYLDMTPYLNFGVFKKIRDPEVFQKVRISFDTIEWPEGIDLDPEFVYAKCKKRTTPAAV